MKIYYAGLRSNFVGVLGGFPPLTMFTYDDVSDYGDGEQKNLLRALLQSRGLADRQTKRGSCSFTTRARRGSKVGCRSS